MKRVYGIPEGISRKAYVALLESLGLEAYYLTELRFTSQGAYAEVYEMDDNGNVVIDELEPVVNRVWIPLVDNIE